MQRNKSKNSLIVSRTTTAAAHRHRHRRAPLPNGVSENMKTEINRSDECAWRKQLPASKCTSGTGKRVNTNTYGQASRQAGRRQGSTCGEEKQTSAWIKFILGTNNEWTVAADRRHCRHHLTLNQVDALNESKWPLISTIHASLKITKVLCSPLLFLSAFPWRGGCLCANI